MFKILPCNFLGKIFGLYSPFIFLAHPLFSFSLRFLLSFLFHLFSRLALSPIQVRQSIVFSFFLFTFNFSPPFYFKDGGIQSETGLMYYFVLWMGFNSLHSRPLIRGIFLFALMLFVVVKKILKFSL